MKKVLLAIVIALLPISAQARKHVTIHKAPPHVSTQPVLQVPVAFIPPLAIFYDLARRTDCRGDVLGMGGAGFDAEPKTGNFLIPAAYRSECNPAAAPHSRRQR